MTRTLSTAPTAFLDPATGRPSFGAFEGSLPRIDVVGRSLLARIGRRKKWLYLAIASDKIWVSLAVVRLGYAASAFAFVFDFATRRLLFDRSVIAPPKMADVTDDPSASGRVAHFGFGRTHIDLERREARAELHVRFAELALDVDWDESMAPPAIAAIVELGPSLASATQKRVLARAGGVGKIGARALALDGAVAGYDYTQGLMPRRTRWHWAFAMGRTPRGEPVALNLTEGFAGEAECAVFHDGRVHAIPAPRFAFERKRPERPWRLVGDGIELTFDVAAVHAERTNLGLVRSHFVQPVGHFRGVLRASGRDVELDGVPGVVEDQDVRW